MYVVAKEAIARCHVLRMFWSDSVAFVEGRVQLLRQNVSGARQEFMIRHVCFFSIAAVDSIGQLFRNSGFGTSFDVLKVC
jgi:hypothetical protein